MKMIINSVLHQTEAVVKTRVLLCGKKECVAVILKHTEESNSGHVPVVAQLEEEELIHKEITSAEVRV